MGVVEESPCQMDRMPETAAAAVAAVRGQRQMRRIRNHLVRMMLGL